MAEKISLEAYVAFLRKFYRSGDYASQRLGQAFVNHFGIECDHDSHTCLFYETDEIRAAQKILDYVEDDPTKHVVFWTERNPNA